VWLRVQYSPFTDAGFMILAVFLMAMYLILEWTIVFLAIRFKLYKIKHENTAWHLVQKEEDELDIPGWEDIKGASSEAYVMNQRITSETFRYKFLNYNRTWLINQLPQLLTPRTMRRSRPYLINQFARIINAKREDISDDSDKDQKDKKFGPVALTAPSRNIIRWWLGKARRRLRLRNIVDPLIKRARGSQCEQCLSRKQLQIEYEVDVDKMAEMYDRTYPGDEEVDQVQWKAFWVNNQRYHTICLACLTKRKEVASRNALKGAMEPKIEPEIVFKLRSAPRPGMSEEELADCIDWFAHGYEIVHSVYPGWKFQVADTIAAFGMHGVLIVGTPRQVRTIRGLNRDLVKELRGFRISLFRDGKLMDSGAGANVLDSPLMALKYMVDLAGRQPNHHMPAAGEVITTGTLTAALPIKPGETWHTAFTGLDLPGLTVRFV